MLSSSPFTELLHLLEASPMSYYNAYPAGGYPYPPQPQYPPQAQYPPPAAPVSSYPGLPPTGPTPYSYPQPYGEACPSTGPFPMPPQQSAAYQPYQVAPGPPPYTNPAAHPVPAPTAGGIRKAFLVGINYIGNPNAHLEYDLTCRIALILITVVVLMTRIT